MRKGSRITQVLEKILPKPKPRKQVDLESVDLRNVKTPKLFFPNFYRVGNIVGPDAFRHELDKFQFCDSLTYTVTDKFQLPVRRLIYCISEHGRKPHAIEGAKQVVGNHAKLMICYLSENLRPSAYMGSMNHTASTNFNLMYRLSPDESLQMEEFFKRIWESH